MASSYIPLFLALVYTVGFLNSAHHIFFIDVRCLPTVDKIAGSIDF